MTKRSTVMRSSGSILETFDEADEQSLDSEQKPVQSEKKKKQYGKGPRRHTGDLNAVKSKLTLIEMDDDADDYDEDDDAFYGEDQVEEEAEVTLVRSETDVTKVESAMNEVFVTSENLPPGPDEDKVSFSFAQIAKGSRLRKRSESTCSIDAEVSPMTQKTTVTTEERVTLEATENVVKVPEEDDVEIVTVAFQDTKDLVEEKQDGADDVMLHEQMESTQTTVDEIQISQSLIIGEHDSIESSLAESVPEQTAMVEAEVAESNDVVVEDSASTDIASAEIIIDSVQNDKLVAAEVLIPEDESAPDTTEKTEMTDVKMNVDLPLATESTNIELTPAEIVSVASTSMETNVANEAIAVTSESTVVEAVAEAHATQIP